MQSVENYHNYVNLILKCKQEGKYTSKYKITHGKLARLYGSTKKWRLIEVETRLKHDLSVQSKILRDKKTIAERQRINSLFHSNPKMCMEDSDRMVKLRWKKHHRKKKQEIFGKTSGQGKGRLIRKVYG